MTIDEIAYAGGKYNTNLPSPYAWYYLNSAGGSITGRIWWWSLSPNIWDGSSSDIWSVRCSSNPGYLGSNYVSNSTGVRPVLSLKSCIKYSTGDGSATNPYTILETSSGC